MSAAHAQFAQRPVARRGAGFEDRGVRAAAATLLLLSACDHSVVVDDLAVAIASAAHDSRLVIAHFRLPGRPLSSAMDDALTPARLRELAPDFTHCRLDAEQHVHALRTALGGTQRRGACLATCLLDGHGTALVAHIGFLDGAGFAQFLNSARRHLRERQACMALAEPERSFALAALDGQHGRRDLAAARLRELTQHGEATVRARACAQLARLCAQDGDVAGARHWLAAGEQPGDLLADATLRAHRALTTAQVALHARTPRAALAALAHEPLPADRAAHLLCLGQARHECGDTAAALETLRTLRSRHAGSVEADAAARTIDHILDPNHGHSHGD